MRYLRRIKNLPRDRQAAVERSIVVAFGVAPFAERVNCSLDHSLNFAIIAAAVTFALPDHCPGLLEKYFDYSR